MRQAKMQRYTGSCHCQKVQLAVESELKQIVVCNCSLCKKRNAHMLVVPAKQFLLTTGFEYLTLYQFHSRKAKHYFCKHCGIYVYHEVPIKAGHIAINVFCLDHIDPSQIETVHFDGAAL